MPISRKLVEPRLSQVGVLRLGDSKPTKNGGKIPGKLEKWRGTSPSKAIIEELAALHGGEPMPWASDDGPQWQVYTTTTAIEVFVPRQRIDPYLEAWDRKVLQRRCDGETERLRGTPCLCLQGCRLRGEHDFEANVLTRGECPCGAKRACKPTTRFSVLIADIHAAGTWKVESHGWNAAAELPGMAEGIANATEPVPAVLRLRVQLGAKLKIENGHEGIEPRKFIVPWLDFNGLFTPRQAFTGELSAAARAAIGAPSRAAIAAGPIRAKLTEEQVLEQAGHLRQEEQVRALWTQAGQDNVLTSRVKAALEATAADLKEKREQRDRVVKAATPAAAPAATPPPAPAAARKAAPAKRPAAPAAKKDDVVDAVIVPEADIIRRAWGNCEEVARRLDLDRPALAQRFKQHFGYDHRDDSKAVVADFELFGEQLRADLGRIEASPPEGAST